MSTYEKTIHLEKAEVEYINNLLTEKAWESSFGRSDIIDVYSTAFSSYGHDVEVDIKVINGDDEDSGAWIDAVLFDSNGQEIFALPAYFDRLDGEYIFELDGNSFIVRVVGDR